MGRKYEVDIDAFVALPDETIATLKAGQDEMLRGAQELHGAIERQRQVAIQTLVRAGIDMDRLGLWSEQGSSDCGVMVDGEKACTIHVSLSDTTITVATEWHRGPSRGRMSDAKTVKPGEAVRYHNEPIRPVTFSPRPADPVVERLTLLVNLFARNAKVRLKWDGHVYSFKVNERGRIELASDGLHRGWFVDAEDIEVVE